MTYDDPQAPWPPRYPAAGTEPSHEPKSERPWGPAFAWVGVVYALLLVVEFLRLGSGGLAYRIGEMIPGALITAVVLAFLAGALKRPCPWWAMALAAFVVLGGWYFGMSEVRTNGNDARAEASGEADYVLVLPESAGEFSRNTNAQAAARGKDALALFEKEPEATRQGMDLLYAEYRQGREKRAVFVGFNASGRAMDELRDSSNVALVNVMGGAGVKDFQDVDSGDLGGAMGCADDAPVIPAGVVFCAWADASTVGQLSLAAPDLDIAAAAELTRQFRKAATDR